MERPPPTREGPAERSSTGAPRRVSRGATSCCRSRSPGLSEAAGLTVAVGRLANGAVLGEGPEDLSFTLEDLDRRVNFLAPTTGGCTDEPAAAPSAHVPPPGRRVCGIGIRWNRGPVGAWIGAPAGARARSCLLTSSMSCSRGISASLARMPRAATWATSRVGSAARTSCRAASSEAVQAGWRSAKSVCPVPPSAIVRWSAVARASPRVR